MAITVNFGRVPEDEKEKYRELLKPICGLINAHVPTHDADVEVLSKALATTFQDDIQNRLRIGADAIIDGKLSDTQCYGAQYIAATSLVMATSILSQGLMRDLLKMALADLDKIEQFGDLLFYSLGNSLQMHRAKQKPLH